MKKECNLYTPWYKYYARQVYPISITADLTSSIIWRQRSRDILVLMPTAMRSSSNIFNHTPRFLFFFLFPAALPWCRIWAPIAAAWPLQCILALWPAWHTTRARWSVSVRAAGWWMPVPAHGWKTFGGEFLFQSACLQVIRHPLHCHRQRIWIKYVFTMHNIVCVFRYYYV